MNLKTNELNDLHGRVGQESNLHLLQDAGFLAQKTDHASRQNMPQVEREQIIQSGQKVQLADGQQIENVYQSKAGYLEDLPVYDEKTPTSAVKSPAQSSWIKARSSDDSGLDCAGEAKGFAVKLFGFTLLSSLEYKKSRLCESRQLVDATCELADLKGQRLSDADTLQEREQAGRSVLNSTKMCVDSMQAATTELQEAKLDAQRKEGKKQHSAEDPQCSTSKEGFVRNMLRCDA